MKEKEILLFVLSFLFVLGAKAQLPEPETPYYGITNIEAPQLVKVYPPVPVPGQTPAFTKQGEAFTTQEELLAYISMLDERSDWLTVRFIGTSQQGRLIPALYFTKEKDISPESFSKKPTVWLHAQIHGDEPGGGEAALVIAERLTGEFGEEVLDKVNVIIIPRQNPDGSYAFKRSLASGDDGNLDHTILERQENQVIHNEFKRYSPEVVIDAHEYGPYRANLNQFGDAGLVEYHDILLYGSKNLNIPEELRDFIYEKFVNPTHQELQNQGYSSEEYYTGGPNNQSQIILMSSELDARIGSNAFGLHTSVSLLVESRGIGLGRQNFPRRVASQVVAHENIIRTAAKLGNKLKKFIAKQRAKVTKKGLKTSNNNQIVLNSTPSRIDNLPFQFVDIARAEVIELPVTYYNWADAMPTFTRERPIAYFVRPEFKDIADRLEIQGVQGFVLPVDLELPVETYKVIGKVQGILVQTEIVEKIVTLPKGTFVYPTAQPTSGILSLSLEPEYIGSFTTYGFVPAEVGMELPIYRFMLDCRPIYDEIYSRI